MKHSLRLPGPDCCLQCRRLDQRHCRRRPLRQSPPTNGFTSIPPRPLPDLAGAKPVQVLYKTAFHP